MEQLKGNGMVGQSGGPTVAINATLSGVIEGFLHYAEKESGVTLYGMRNGIEGLLTEDLVDLGARFDRKEELVWLMQTPAAALGSCRKRLPAMGEGENSVYEEILRIFRKYDIRYFFYIGGNDSMDAVEKLSGYMQKSGYDVCVVGVPKTIDNDLMLTDHTPGFGSAAKYIAVTMQEILRDCAVYRIPAVTVVEIMGRDAGWLTASAAMGGFAGGGEVDLVYLPERVFDMERFLQDVAEKLAKHPNVVVAVSEGLRTADGRYVGEGTQSGATDSFGHRYLAGTAKTLEAAVKSRFGCKVRSVELNLPQRCAAHLSSRTDWEEAVAIGKAAVAAAIEEGISGEMMCFTRVSDTPYCCRIDHVPVERVANAVRLVPDGFINCEGNGVTSACATYLLPLMAGENAVQYRNGFPIHLVL